MNCFINPFSFGKYFGTKGLNIGSDGTYYQFDVVENSYYGIDGPDTIAEALIDLIENENVSISEVNELLLRS